MQIMYLNPTPEKIQDALDKWIDEVLNLCDRFQNLENAFLIGEDDKAEYVNEDMLKGINLLAERIRKEFDKFPVSLIHPQEIEDPDDLADTSYLSITSDLD